MPSVTGDIRIRIQETIRAIEPPVGIVHEYLRWTAAEDRLREIAFDPLTGGIRAWFVSREGSEGERQPPDQANRYATYVVVGFRAWNDAERSEPLFDGEVEAIQDALGADVDLGDLADHVEEPQVRLIEPRMWAGVLCHYAEIAVRVHLTMTYTFTS